MPANLPEPTGGFAWVQAPEGPALVCRSLEPVAPHLFTTRPWLLGSAPADSEAAWQEVAAAIGVGNGRLARVHQVHGSRVVAARPNDRPDADVVVSADGDLAVAIQTADCVPLLIADLRTGVVAAAHAGWRGLAARTPAAAVEALVRRFAVRPADLVAAAGPSIGACCYEVGADVRRRFEEEGFVPGELAAWFLMEPRSTPRNRSFAGVPSTPRPDRWYFDGWAAARDQLLATGLEAGQIHVAELCTASHAA